MPADDNRFILSGSSLLKNISGDVLLMAELYRHTRCVEASLFQGRACVREHGALRFPFRTEPRILIVAKLCAQSSFDDGILRSTVFHQLSRHRLEHVEESDAYIRRLAQERAHITDGSLGVLGFVDREENSHYRTPSWPAFFSEVSSRPPHIPVKSTAYCHVCESLPGDRTERTSSFKGHFNSGLDVKISGIA